MATIRELAKSNESSQTSCRQQSLDVITDMSRKPIPSIWVVGILLSPFVLGQIPQTAPDLYPFVKNDRLGFIDSKGREVISPQFGTAADSARFREGLANVGGGRDWGDGRNWGYIDASGKFVVEPKFWWAFPFSEGLACVLLPEEGAGYGFIDRTGSLLIKGLKVPSSFHDGLAPVAVGGKWGYLGTDMKIAIPAQFDLADPFSEGMAQVKIGGKWGYIDKAGRILVQPKYDIVMPFSDGLGRVKIFYERRPLEGVIGMEGQTTYDVYVWGFVDKYGVEIISPKFLEVTDFSEGYAFAMANDGTNLFGIIDKSGKYVQEPTFDEATAFSESLAAVRIGKKWGFVDHEGRWAIPPTLAHAEPFWHGLARVAFGRGRWGYVDKKGSVVWQNKSE